MTEQETLTGPYRMSLIQARYRWASPSPIEEMDVLRIAGGKVRCQLVPREGYDPGTLAEIPPHLQTLGFEHIYADVVNGKNVLMVDQLKDATHLVQALKRCGMVKGEAQRIALPKDAEEEQKGVVGRAISTIQGDTVKWSGRIGLLGHASIFVKGVVKKDPGTIWGASGAITPIILSMYGNGKAEINFNDMMDKMRDYFRAEGVPLPDDGYSKKNGTLMKGFDKLLSSYPLQIAHGLGSYGAYNWMKSGWKEYKGGNPKSLGLFAAGATSLAGNGAIVFIPENKKAQDNDRTALQEIQYGLQHIPEGVQFAATKPLQVPAKIGNFVKDSPMRFNGILNSWDNLFWFVNVVGQFDERRKHPPQLTTLRGKLNHLSPYYTMVTAVSFAMATFLSMISSKNRDAQYLQEEMYEPAFAAAAKFLVQMPLEQREATLNRMALFLSEQEAVKDGNITAEKIVAEVRDRIQTLENSPWIARIEVNKEKQQDTPSSAIA